MRSTLRILVMVAALTIGGLTQVPPAPVVAVAPAPSLSATTSIEPVKAWLNANTQQCPNICISNYMTRQTIRGEPPPRNCFGITIFASCRNHGMDESSCTVTEIIVDFVILAFVGSVGAILYIFRASLPLQTVPNSSRSSNGSKLEDAGYQTAPADSPNETIQFLRARVPAIESEHGKILASIKDAKNRYDRWWYLSQILGFWNIFIPAVSIVFQALLKVGDVKTRDATIKNAEIEYNATHPLNQVHPGFKFDAYDLKECSRSYRAAFVAAFTVTTLVITTLIKLLNPSEVAGVEKEKKERNEKLLAQFEASLAGVLTLGDGSGEDKRAEA